MNYSDEQLLGFCKNSTIQYIKEIKTWADFKTFLNTITKAKFKTKLKKYFQDDEIESDDSILKHQEKILKDQDAILEIDNL